MNEGFSEQLNSLFLDLTNIKSDVIVSWEFIVNDPPKLAASYIFLLFNPSELYIVGCDFFNIFKEAKRLQKTIIEVKDVYAEGFYSLEQFNINNKDLNGVQLKYFKKLRKNNQNIKIEKSFKIILNQH